MCYNRAKVYYSDGNTSVVKTIGRDKGLIISLSDCLWKICIQPMCL